MKYYDNGYIWTRDYAKKLRGYMQNKNTEHERYLRSEAYNLLTANEKEQINQRQQLLKHTLTLAINSVESLLQILDPGDDLTNDTNLIE